MTWDVRAFGAKGDGLSDDTAAINAAIGAASDAGGGTVEFPEGTYRCQGVIGRHRVSLHGSGAILLKLKGGHSTHILDLTGALSAVRSDLAGEVASGADRLPVRATDGFAPGDQVLIRDGNYAYGTRGRNQELNRVTGAESGTLVLANRTLETYRASDGEVIRLEPTGDLILEGLTFVVPEQATGQAGGGVFGRLATRVTVRDCVAVGPDDDAGFQFEESAWVVIDGCQVRDGQHCGPLGRGNGIVFGESSHHCLVTRCRTENVSENAFEDNVRHSAFIDNIDWSSHDDAFNTHGSACRHIRIQGNLCVSGRRAGVTVGFAGHHAGDVDVVVSDNTIVDPGTHGISVASPGNRPNLDIVVQGNAIWRPSRNGPGSTGICVIGSRHVVVIGNRIVGGDANPAHGILVSESAQVVVRGNAIRNLTGGYGISYGHSDTVTIAGNTLEDIASYNVYAAPPGASTGVVVQGNRADDGRVLLQADDADRDNAWGAGPASGARVQP